MAFTQDDVDSLKKAIARGVRTVKLNGEEVTYGSFAELRKALAMAESEVAAIPRNAIGVTYPRTGRGL